MNDYSEDLNYISDVLEELSEEISVIKDYLSQITSILVCISNHTDDFDILNHLCVKTFVE